MNLPNLYGWNKTSEAGQELFAVSVFLGACNYRCPYCMNSKLVTDTIQIPQKSWGDVLEYLSDNDVPMVQVSGGEPTLTPVPQLLALFSAIGVHGCKIGISTNGSKPFIMREIIGRIDYVTLDIKTDDKRYNDLANNPNGSPELAVWATYEMLHNETKFREKFGFEVRTTLYPTHVDEAAIREIGSQINNGVKWVLQPYRQAKQMLDSQASNVQPYTKEEDARLLKIAKEYVKDVSIRYV